MSTVKSSSRKAGATKELQKEPLSPKLSGENKTANIVTPIKPSRKGTAGHLRKKSPASPIEESIDDDITPVRIIEDVEESKQEKSVFSLKDAKRIEVIPQVKKVYQFVNQMTGSLGGNGYNGAIYGELTVGSMQRVINVLIEQCELDHKSRFIDVGSGLGKPNFHASQSPGVRLSIGVELETIRWQLAMHNLHLFVNKFMSQTASVPISSRLNDGVNFIAGDIDNAMSLDPFTHIYMYDLGFPPPLQQSIARKFNNSVHARYLVSYRPPRRVIKEYGYNVEFIARHLTSMFGSGEGHTAYFYKRIGTIPSTPVLSNQKSLTIPKRTNFRLAESDTEVYCDELFYEPAKQATQEVEILAETVKIAIDEHLNSGRSKRATRASTRVL